MNHDVGLSNYIQSIIQVQYDVLFGVSKCVGENEISKIKITVFPISYLIQLTYSFAASSFIVPSHAVSPVLNSKTFWLTSILSVQVPEFSSTASVEITSDESSPKTSGRIVPVIIPSAPQATVKHAGLLNMHSLVSVLGYHAF